MVAWAGLILACFLIGTAILHGVKADCFTRIGDRFIVSVWLGVVILSVSLLAVSLILPLSSFVGIVVTVGLAAVALLSRSTRTEIVAVLSVLSAKEIFGFISLELAVAAYTTQAITYYDTGLYHFQAIRWLSRFGAVPGLALIHSRFGFTSSWFALAAPFNAGIFEARIGALTGGFAFLLATLHFLISFTRIWKNRGVFEDWFVVTSSFLYLPIITFYFYRMPVSSSPDLPLIILTIVITWVNLSLNDKNGSEQNRFIDAKIIPFILSAGVVTIKLSALPLLFASGLFYIFSISNRLNIRRIFLCITISCVLLFPMFGFGIIASGCPLYPSSLMCLDLPWSLGAKNAKAMSQIIQTWARWSGSPPVTANSWNWLWHWIQSEKQATFLIICSILSTIGITRTSNYVQVHGKNYALTLGGLGIAFMMYGAPSLRFGLGYLCILPALLMAVYCNVGSPFMAIAVLVISGASNSWLGFSTTGLAILGATLIVSLVIVLVIRFHRERVAKQFFLIFMFFLIGVIPLKSSLLNTNSKLYFILPPQLQIPKHTELFNRQTNDIKYLVPKLPSGEDQCWAAELPCTPNLTYEDIKLRDPEHGIGAGFIRK